MNAGFFIYAAEKMVKITHYEVYTDSGDGWKLEDRFASDQRYEAINLSKEKEQEKLKVKIIRETFDVQDNSYQETVEYVSGLGHGKPKAKKGKRISAVDLRSQAVARQGEDDSGEYEADEALVSSAEILRAIAKLVVIIIVTLALSNLFVTLISPLIEDFVPEEYVHISLFIIFFVLFLGLAVPLIMKKIPWHIFAYRRQGTAKPRPLKESRFYEKAQNIIRLYNLNDEYEPSISPSYPEATLEQKRYIVDFLKDILSNLDSKSMFQDSFSKLGVKLVVYGGCLELSRYCGLHIAEANSMLYEAFKIIDGDNADLEAFYDGKKSFADNKVAVFLTGVGAHLMAQVIDERPMDVNILKQSFAKWEAQIAETGYSGAGETVPPQKVDIRCPSLVNIQCLLKFFDEALPGLEEQKKTYWSDIHNIIANLLGKYRGRNVIEFDGITTVEYDNTEDAVRFAAAFIKDINTYKDELNDENLIFLSKCNIIDKMEEDGLNPQDYVEDVLEHTYNNEILITEKIKNAIPSDKYGFEFLGDKRLNKTNKLVALYKLAD